MKTGDSEQQGTGKDAPMSQAEKFKQAARDLETDDSQETFDRALKKVAKSPRTVVRKALRTRVKTGAGKGT